MLGSLRHHLALDRAVLFSLVLRLWQSAAGLLGLILIGVYFSPISQGYYYTFVSLVALQSFVELGLYIVITNIASHEWSRLQVGKDGAIFGDRESLSRLISLGRFVFRWYSIAAVVFLVLAGGGGYWFLSLDASVAVEWHAPWLIHAAFSSILLWCMPFLSLLEGCNQVADVARFKVVQSLLSNLLFFSAIIFGAGLWAVPVLSSVSAVACIFYLTVYRRSFFKPFFMQPAHSVIDWRVEMFPMQWRLALMGVFNYFSFSLFTPVMFRYHGPVIAGQMGMSLQLMFAIQTIASVWVMTQIPQFGSFVAKRQFVDLDRSWGKATSISNGMMILGVLLLILVAVLISISNSYFTDRLLSVPLLLLVGGGAIFANWGHCFSIYLRAHKKEVLTPVGVFASILMGTMVWWFGSNYGAIGAAATYFFVSSFVTFPLIYFIWRVSRRQWHHHAITQDSRN